MATRTEGSIAHERKKNEIARTAIKLILKNGVVSTSMRDLAQEVGLTAGSLYHYFHSKDEIIDLVVDHGIRSVDELRTFRKTLGDAKPAEVVKQCATLWLRRADASQDYIIILTRESLAIRRPKLEGVMQAVRDFVSFFEGIVREGIEAGEFDPAVNPTLVAFNVWALQEEWALRRWLLRDRFTIDQYAELQMAAVMKQLSPTQKSSATKRTVPRS